MKIRTHIGISVDGYVSTLDGRPTLLLMPDFESGVSHATPSSSPTAAPSSWDAPRSSRPSAPGIGRGPT